MKTLTTPQRLLTIALMAGSAVAFAQTSGTAGTSTMPAMGASQPTTSIGVTPQAAAEAKRKAVPRSDTATVVRTSPSAVGSTPNAAGMNDTTANTATTGASGAAGTNTTAGMTPAAGSMNNTTKSPRMKKARADRN